LIDVAQWYQARSETAIESVIDRLGAMHPIDYGIVECNPIGAGRESTRSIAANVWQRAFITLSARSMS